MHELLYPLTLPGDPVSPLHAATKQYVDSATGGGTSTLNSLTDVTITTPLSTQVLAYNGVQWVNTAASSSSSVSLLNDLADVVITSPSSSQILSYNGVQWINTVLPPSSNVSLLNDLTDVVITSPSASQILSYDGTQWVNTAAPTGGGGGGGSGTSVDMRFVIATADATTAQQDGADYKLSSITNSTTGLTSATGLNTILNAHRYVKIIGPNIRLDGEVVITNPVDIYSQGTTITSRVNLNSDSASRFAMFKITGTESAPGATWTTAQAKGSRTFVTSTAHGLAVGDWFRIETKENRNINRVEYYKGELNKVLKVDSPTQIEVEVPLRDTYNTGFTNMNIYKLNMLSNVVVDGLVFKTHDSTSTGCHTELFVVQLALQPVIKNCKAIGGASKRAGIGIAASKTVGAVISNCTAQDVLDWWIVGESPTPSGTSRNGYGFYVGGSENTRVVNCDARDCRHGFDINNYGYRGYPVSRYTVFENCTGYRTTQPPFTTHDASYAVYTNCTAIGCGGGFHLRGENFTVTDCKVIEPARQYHAEWIPCCGGWGNGNFSGEGAVRIGEKDYTGTNLQGLAGHYLNITNMVVEFNNPEYKGAAFFCMDPLQDANVQIKVKAGPGQGILLQGDYVRNSNFDIVIHGQKQVNAFPAFEFNPQEVAIAVQEMTNSSVKVISDYVRGPAVIIGGGNNGGKSQYNTINVNAVNLGTGMTASSPQIKFETGTTSVSHGPQYIQSIVAPNSFETSSVSNPGGAVITYGPFVQRKTFALQAWPIVFNSSSATKGNAPTYDLTVPVPSGAIDDDYLLAVWCSQAYSTMTSADVHAPAGFTQLGATQTFNNSNYRFTQFYGRQIPTASALPASYTWSFDTRFTNDRHGLIFLLLRGHGPITMAGNSTMSTVGNPPSTVNFSSFSTTANNALVLSAAHLTCSSGDNSALTIPAGYAQEKDLVIPISTADPFANSFEHAYVFSKPVTTAGTVAAVTTAIADAVVDDATLSIALVG